MKYAVPQIAAWTLVFMSLTSCASQIVPRLYRPREDYERYVKAMEALELHHTALGAEWLESGKTAIEHPIMVSSSAFEVGYFNPQSPDAAGFAFAAPEGKKIEVTVTLDSREQGQDVRLFADLFRVDERSGLQQVASTGEEDDRLYFETRRPGEYILRIQPELLRGGRYFLTIKTDASLGFPVAGKAADSIWSFFGDPRDGGTREHHGVDIFAPRGTPVLAPAAGEVVRVRWNKLGGRIVGVWDPQRRIYYYFAHLEEQLVTVGQQVGVGDTLGTVGDSGNAEGGPPHLHFGMYVEMADPIDPYHFVTRVAGTLGPVEVDEDPIGLWSRTVAAGAAVYASVESSEEAFSLPGFHPLFVTGAQRERYRVRLPDMQVGYVDAQAIEPADDVIAQIRSDGSPIRIEPSRSGDIIAEPVPGSLIDVLGRQGRFSLVEAGGHLGWVYLPQAESPK
jgi:murein DD-endopeptidase MepM/ murein hydrolase activator NlpD